MELTLFNFLICWLINSFIAMTLTYINDKREHNYIDFGIGWVFAHLSFGLICTVMIIAL